MYPHTHKSIVVDKQNFENKWLSDELKWSKMPKKDNFQKINFIKKIILKYKKGYILKTTQPIIFIYITNLNSFCMNNPMFFALKKSREKRYTLSLRLF